MEESGPEYPEKNIQDQGCCENEADKPGVSSEISSQSTSHTTQYPVVGITVKAFAFKFSQVGNREDDP
jgi:hypothetical protein